MTNKFEVKTKSKSLRCEICHQADQFDLETETCLRCQGLVISNLIPQQNNNNFQDWMVNLGTTSSDNPFPTRELVGVIRQAFTVYLQRFFFLFLFASLVLIPLSFFTEEILQYQLGVSDGFYQILITYGLPLLLTPISIGAIGLTVFDHQRNQQTSFLSVFKRLFNTNGINFVLTSFVGQLYQLIGFLFCWLGVLYTYPSGAFISETAIIEEKYGINAIKNSHKIGMRVPIFLLFLGLLSWVVPKFGSAFLGEVLAQKGFYGFGQNEITHVLYLIFQIFIFPLVTVMKMLMYLRLRPQEQDSSQPISNSSNSTFRLR
jgi:hypothetical protein